MTFSSVFNPSFGPHCLDGYATDKVSIISSSFNVDCTDDQLEDAQVATERALMSKIFKEAFYPNGLTDVDNDR